MIDPAKITDIAAFRAAVALHGEVPTSQSVDLCAEPDWPRFRTFLLKVACEILLRVTDVDIGRTILEDGKFPADWVYPVREAVEFIEAEDAGEFQVS
jgi:hypothetical protein